MSDVTSEPCLIDTEVAIRRFAKLAANESERSPVASECGQRLAERTELLKIPPGLVLDVGCGATPGVDAKVLGGQVIGIDRCQGGLTTGSIAADVTALPFADNSFGCVWLNLILPWINNPQAVLLEIRRILTEGGLLMMSSLGPDSLQEIRWAFAENVPHTIGFFDMHDLGDLLQHSGFAEPVVDCESFTLTYSSAQKLLIELSSWGVLAAPGMRKSLTGKQRWRKACEQLTDNAGAHLTIEAIYAHGWALPQRKPKIADHWQEISFT